MKPHGPTAGALPAPRRLSLPHLKWLRWLGVWAPTAFVVLAFLFVKAAYQILPTWLVHVVAFGLIAVAAYLFSGFVFAQIQRREETILHQTRELEALHRVGAAVSSSLRLDEVLERALDATLAALEMEAGEIFLLDEEKGELVLALHRGLFPESFREIPRFRLGEGLAGRVALSGEPLVTTDLAKDLRWLRKEVVAAGFRTFACLPLRARGKVIGTLDIATRAPRDFTAADLQLLTTIGGAIGMAVANARLYEDLRMAATQLETRVEERTRDLQAANRKLEEALSQVEAASRHKSEFLANMSHELRTPLNSILGFSQLLQTQTVGPLTEKQARYITHIHTGGEHLLALINDLLDLSKVEAGKLDLQPQPFEVREALAAALREVQPQAEAKSQGLELQVEEPLPSLTADPLRFKQILLNLLSNAIKFTPEGGRITVSARVVSGGEGTGEPERRGIGEGSAPVPRFADAPGREERDYLELRVQDTGIGIRPEDLPKLFQPFIQLEPAYGKRHPGTGLGLALTKRLVELHGGTIRAESEGAGCGATVTVRLPLIPPAPEGTS